jgi:hypothetical protein
MVNCSWKLYARNFARAASTITDDHNWVTFLERKASRHTARGRVGKRRSMATRPCGAEMQPDAMSDDLGREPSSRYAICSSTEVDTASMLPNVICLQNRPAWSQLRASGRVVAMTVVHSIGDGQPTARDPLAGR